MKKRFLQGRRKFMLGLSSLTIGAIFFGYKALGKNAIANDKESNLPSIKSNARLGINLSGIAYWGSEFPLVNLMYQSGEWVSQTSSRDWGTGPPLALDVNGWVMHLEKGRSASKVICSGGEVQYPSGIYTLLYDGEGDIELNPSVAKTRTKTQGRHEYHVDASKGTLILVLLSTNPKNYIHNIRIILPGFESSYQQNPWHPNFLVCWSGVACIRFMDMMATNNSNQKNWIDRPKLNDATFVEKGLPLELMIDLANRLNTDAWFCLPHQVGDDYIKQFAIMVNESLHLNSKAWIEHSNEVWNGGFAQYHYAAKEGKRLKLAEDEWEAAYRYNVKRSIAIFDIWNAVFTQHDRVVRVIASQAANVYLSKAILNVGEIARVADVLAIAPYVSLNVPVEPDDRGVSLKSVSSWRLDDVFNYLNTVALPETERWITENNAVAAKHGLAMVAYEAGQHLVAYGEAADSKVLTQLLLLANEDRRMGDIYQKHLNFWQAAGGDLICMYNSIGSWSKWGSWGLLKHINDRTKGKATPKFNATMQWAKSRGQKVAD
jgi:hypothetical protein